MSATREFIETLGKLKAGDLGLLRTQAHQGLDESLEGFDLFAGLWWPLRQKNQKAPRREVAWLVAKLFAFRPVTNTPGDTLAGQLGLCRGTEKSERARTQAAFDRLLTLPLSQIETSLRWALDRIHSQRRDVDWVRLTDDLSQWERESVRIQWADQFLTNSERDTSC